MTQVLTVFGVTVSVLLLVGGPCVVIRWHRREGQQRRARALVLARILRNRAMADTAVIPVIRDDATPEQPEGRGRTPDSAASLRYPAPVPTAAVTPRAAAVGTGPRDVSQPGPAVRPSAGRRRAPSSIAELGGESRTRPPVIRAAP